MTIDVTTDRSVAGQLRSGWFCLVSEIADLGLQRRMWLDPTNDNPHWSYIEFTCSYPDPDQLLQARREGWLGTSEHQILAALGQAIDAYAPPRDDDYDNAAVLADPAWHRVVEAADQARSRLLAIAIDEGEKEVLRGGA